MEDIDIFLSPRFPEGNYINYSFPSKILDYIAFFKPIITYKIPCYDEKLDEILIYPKDLSIESFVSSIKEAIGTTVDKDKFISYLEKIDSHNIVSDILNMGIRHK